MRLNKGQLLSHIIQQFDGELNMSGDLQGKIIENHYWIHVPADSTT